MHAQVDPIEWKTELERVGPKLRAQQQLTSNEWRAHVDSTIHNKSQIEKVLSDTQGDLQAINRYGSPFACIYMLINIHTASEKLQMSWPK